MNVDYVKESDLSSLTGIFGKSNEETPENEKLIDLYWNRNELKKEFAGLRKEQFRLEGKIREQDGVCARLEQQIGHIEGLLIDPESARSVLVFYQLRSVALRCENKLATFAEQLKQTQEQKLNERCHAEWNEYRAQEAGPNRAAIIERRNNIQHLEDLAQFERRLLGSRDPLADVLCRDDRRVEQVMFFLFGRPGFGGGRLISVGLGELHGQRPAIAHRARPDRVQGE